MTSDKLTVNELFSGIGAQRKALERLEIDHEVVGICEIDKYAIQSYKAIYGETKNYGDICTAPRVDYADLWTYSFPCQDISVAGKQQGINENTRSGLLYQVQRLLEVAKDEGTLPKYLLLENVKNLVGKQFKSQFEDWLFYLDQLGYDTYWQVLNAKNYGIPQNRERVFAISIRKDLNQSFEFPKAEELKIRLKDVLEDEVEEKFYLKDSIVSSFVDKIKCQNKYKPDVINPLKGKTPYGWHFEQAVYDSNGIARAVKAGGGSGNIPKVIEPKIQQIGNIVSTGNWDNPQRGRIYSAEGLSPALNTVGGGGLEPKILEGIRIRKLTPLETWRLMGFDDEDFYKAQKSGVSNSQLYKQAGNSIVVNVLEKIFKNLL